MILSRGPSGPPGSGMNRFERRVIVQRGRKASRVDPVLRAREAPRGRVLRAIRTRLRMGQPVIARTWRWDAPTWWLDDLSDDLRSGAPAILSRRLDLATVGKDADACARIPAALAELFGVTTRPAPTPTEQSLFDGVRDVLVAAARNPTRRLLVLQDVDCVGPRLTAALVGAWRESRRRAPAARVPRLLITARLGGVPLELRTAHVCTVPDGNALEAELTLAEMLGAERIVDIRRAVLEMGTVAGFLARVTEVGLDRLDMAVVRAVGDIARTLATIESQPVLLDRLRALADASTPLPFADTDPLLHALGFLHTPRPGYSALRSPLIGQALDVL